MGKLIKKAIALLLVMGLCISSSYVINVKAEDLPDRVLTSEDIPDEALYNLMLGAGDSNGNGELTLEEAALISYLKISTVISNFKGLELIDKVQIDIMGEDVSIMDVSEVELITQKLIDYDNIYYISISSEINEAVYANLMKMSLTKLDIVLYPGFDFSVINQLDVSDKPLYASLNDLKISYPFTLGTEIISIECFTGFSNMQYLSIETNANVTGTDALDEFNLVELMIYGAFDENVVIDLSENTDLSYVQIVALTFGSMPTVIIGDNEIETIILENVKFSDQPTSCGYLCLNFCDLKDMSMDFSEYENIYYLKISNCGISEITGVNNCEKLLELDLSGNELSKVPLLCDLFDSNCKLNLANNNFTKEELLANAPECFSSSIIWMYSALAKKVATPIGTVHYDVYSKFDSEYFQAVLDFYGYGSYIYMMWNTDCNEIVIEKAVLEAAAKKSSEVIFEFQYVDELGNVAGAVVNLSEALTELNDDCVINFGFAADNSMKDKWGTEYVYVDLHKQYGEFTTYIDGVTYSIRDYLCNVYNATGEGLFYKVNPYEIIEKVGAGEIASSDTLYYIPISLDTNSGVTSEEGVHAGKQNIVTTDVHIEGINYDTVNAMADGSSISTNISYGISDDVWNLLISKEMTLNLYIIDETGMFVDGVITFSYEEMLPREREDVYFLSSRLFNLENEKCFSVYFDNVTGSVTARLYVGDIAKNGETVCMVTTYDYISVNKEITKGYEIVSEYTVESGMIELSCNSFITTTFVNKTDTVTAQKLELPSGDFIAYKKGDLVVSTKGFENDNVDLRGWKGGLTVSGDFEYCGGMPYGTFFALLDRTKSENEPMGIVLDTDGTTLYLTVVGGGKSSQIEYPTSELSLEDGGSFDVSMYYIDGECCLSLYFNDKLIGKINVTTSGVTEFGIAELNTIYNNEYNSYKQEYSFRNTELSIYAGNLFGEDEISTDTPSDSDEETTDDKDEAVFVQPEQIEAEKIVEPEKAVEVLIEDISTKEDKTVDIVSSEAPVIDENVFDSMINNDKNITFSVTDEDNNLQYSWSFASDLIDKPEISVDLQIEVSKVNDKVDEKLNYDKKVYIEFKHHGELPGPATVKVYVGDQYKVNDKVQLYYYDEENDKILKVGNKSLVVKAGGYIEFTISHCSTYFALEEKEAIQFNKEQNIEMDKDSFEDVGFDVIMSNKVDVNTGVEFASSKVWLFALMGISSLVAFGVTAVVTKRRKTITR